MTAIAAPPPAAASAGEVGQGVRQALRLGVGCDAAVTVRLTPEERDRCNQRIGEQARLGPKTIDRIAPEKRAYFDAVQAAYQASRDPMHSFVRDANGEIKPWGHFAGVGCGMSFGGPPRPPDHRSFTDKVKASGMIAIPLGPLSCGLVLPQGNLTPEIGIPTPQ